MRGHRAPSPPHFSETPPPVCSRVRNSTSWRKMRRVQGKSGGRRRNKERRLVCLFAAAFPLRPSAQVEPFFSLPFSFHNSYVTREACLVSEAYEEVTHLCMKLHYTSATRRGVLGVINPLQQSVADVCVSLGGTRLTSPALLLLLTSFV